MRYDHTEVARILEKLTINGSAKNAPIFQCNSYHMVFQNLSGKELFVPLAKNIKMGDHIAIMPDGRVQSMNPDLYYFELTNAKNSSFTRQLAENAAKQTSASIPSEKQQETSINMLLRNNPDLKKEQLHFIGFGRFGFQARIFNIAKDLNNSSIEKIPCISSKILSHKDNVLILMTGKGLPYVHVAQRSDLEMWYVQEELGDKNFSATNFIKDAYRIDIAELDDAKIRQSRFEKTGGSQKPLTTLELIVKTAKAIVDKSRRSDFLNARFVNETDMNEFLNSVDEKLYNQKSSAPDRFGPIGDIHELFLDATLDVTNHLRKGLAGLPRISMTEYSDIFTQAMNKFLPDDRKKIDELLAKPKNYEDKNLHHKMHEAIIANESNLIAAGRIDPSPGDHGHSIKDYLLELSTILRQEVKREILPENNGPFKSKIAEPSR